MEPRRQRPSGMATFTIIWAGQIASLLGTAMSQFGLTLWAYDVTGRATPLALIGFFFVVPQVVLAPFIGVLVDRSNRKLMMMLADVAAALTTVLILGLHATGNLQIWHLYFTAAIVGLFQGFQWPAYSAAISLMLPKEQYARANGMLDLAGSSSAVIAPILAGVLIGPIGLAGILVIDLVSAAIAITTLLFAHIPQPAQAGASDEEKVSFLRDTAYGFRYILARPSLLGLQIVFLVGNFLCDVALAVLAPMILGRTGSNELIFGSVQSAGAIGGVVGGVVMSAWGGPKRLVHGVILGWALGGVLGQAVLGLAQTTPVWAVGMFFLVFFSPFLNGCNQAIWQSKVPPSVQGRVFSVRVFIAWLVSPLARLLAGPLADQVFEPAMIEGGSLASTFGWLVGTGTGAGIALMFVLTGLLRTVLTLSAYLFPAVRDAEDLLPDHDAASRPEGAVC